MTQQHVISKIEAFAFRYPIAKPVETSFGRMTDRPAVFVRIEAEDGCFGWGEVFANWPAAGAEHRVNLLNRDIAQLVMGQSIGNPAVFFDDLSRKTHIRALQCGEFGPFQQVIAGIDTALWDLKARAAGLPLRKLLNPDAPDQVPAYASGIHIGAARDRIPEARACGYAAFKVKVGFDLDEDLRLLADLFRTLEAGDRLFADANQAFDVVTAKEFFAATEGMPLGWLEEPIAADAPNHYWAELADATDTPLAGGENISGDRAFAECLETGHLDVIQPDVAKWGGVTGCFRVARAVISAGRVYCPHFLGGGIGLAASAEILAAAGGQGLLEVDVNANPLREVFGHPGIDPDTGFWPTVNGAGLGILSIPDALADYMVHRVCID
jgi:L-alanine-DL-glutamate epimerase-like enolase superfamily enzyme